MKKILIQVGIIVLIILVGYFIWYIAAKNSKIPYVYYPPNQKALVDADITRLTDFSSIEIDLEKYYEVYKKYPTAVGSTSIARWQNLSDLMVKEYSNLGYTSPLPLPQDPRQKETGYSFDYQTDSTQQNSVIKTTLEVPDDSSVQGDIRVQKGLDPSHNGVSGIIYGLDCNKPNYCELSKHRPTN